MIGNFFYSSTGAAAAYEIEQSLRFDGSSYLTRTPSSAGNRRTWTMSMWVKFSDNTTNRRGMFGMPTGADNSRYVQWYIHSNNLKFSAYNETYRRSEAAYRDYSAWSHIVLRSDTTQSSEPDRLRIYVNGELILARNTAQSVIDVPQNQQWGVNNTDIHYIGSSGGTSEYFFSGYIAEFYIVDGSSLAPTSFGEFDDNGVWRPIAYTGSYGTNGVYLKFDPSATNGIGHDHSGNGNNFSPTGFTTSGTGTDVMDDTPTNNFATLNPLELGASSFSQGNLFAQANGSNQNQTYNSGTPVPTIQPTSGKWYVEFTPSTLSNMVIGTNYQDPPGSATGSFGTNSYYFRNGEIWINGSGTVATVSSYGSGDVIGVLLDADAQTIRFSKNGTLLDQARSYAGSPGANFPQIITFKQGSSSGSCTATVNYGQRPFNSQPTGYNALCTANLPAPDIADGSQDFQTVLWTGDGATSRNITTNFSPDFAIIKQRDDIYGFGVYDIVRGGGKFLRTDGTPAETTNPADGYVSAFNSTSVTLAKGSYGWNVNGSGYTYVGWFWDGGGTGSSNTAGSITSTVSANASAGFSVVAYTGNGSNGATFGHGLGVAPSFVIVKCRDQSYGWAVQHQSLASNEYLFLNGNFAKSSGNNFWNSTRPSSTVITLGNDGTVNQSSQDYIAYCFAEVEGYSKFGSYTGNGSTDGPFVYCGFRPALVLTKDTTGHNWELLDSTRDAYNVAEKRLFTSNATAESTSETCHDFVSNGFKVRGDHGGNNVSGNLHIFIAFAENPFGGDGVSPATAR